MKYMRLVLIPLAFVLAGAGGCEDQESSPDYQLWKGQKLDLARMHGTVAVKDVRYFPLRHEEDHKVYKKGDPYYCLGISPVGSNGSNEYCGVTTANYDSVEVGSTLPKNPVLTLKDLSQLYGRIIGKYIDSSGPNGPRFFVVVDDFEEVVPHQIDIKTYYRSADIGLRLPFRPDGPVEEMPAEPGPLPDSIPGPSPEPLGVSTGNDG